MFVRRKLTGIIFSLFVLVLAVLCYYHETWRDEVQAFMIVRDSGSLSDLFQNTRYEGHPSLWFLILFGLKTVSPAILGMKVIHYFIVIAAALLFFKFSPFTVFQKTCFIFGYYLLFEYGCIARNYSLGILFVMAFCSLYRRRHSNKNVIWLGGLIFLMMQSNFYSFFIGIGFSFLLIYDWLVNYKSSDPRSPIVFLIFFVVAGIGCFLLDTVPPPDYGYASEWVTSFDVSEVKKLFGRCFEVFVPLPSGNQHFWNMNIITDPTLLSLGGLMVLAVIFCFMVRSRVVRFTLAVIFLEILLFSYFKFSGYLRHNGHLMIALVALKWLEFEYSGEKSMNRTGTYLFNGLLLVQLVASFTVYRRELIFPFSESVHAAEYISEKFSEHVIVSHEDAAGSAVNAYLRKPFFYPSSRSFGTFMIWNQDRYRRKVELRDVVRQGDSLSKISRKPVLYLLSFPADNADSLELRKTFTQGIEPSEQYYLYTRTKK